MCWRPDGSSPDALAVDAERIDQPVPPALGRRHPVGQQRFWRDWTAAEASAKLSGTPILQWIADRGFTALPEIRTVLVDDLVVSGGAVASDRR